MPKLVDRFFNANQLHIDMNYIQLAREKYRPQKVKLIFIAEAPPCTEGQFFYFNDVQKGDSLFLHIIRAVFPDLEEWETKLIRAKKEELLFRFRDAGYFLEDSVPQTIGKGTKPKEKQAIIIKNQAGLINRIEPYKEKSKLILLSSLVFKLNYTILKNNGFTILNDFMIPFPGSGQQGKFKDGMANIEFEL